MYQLFIESSPIGEATPTEPTRKATLTFGNLYYLIIYFLKLLFSNHFLLFKVDLAGAEPKTDKNAEGKNINLSLTFISRYFKGLPNVDPKALPSRNARDDSTKLIGLICGSSETTFLFCLAATRRRQCRLTLESAFSLKKIKIDAVANVKRLTQTERQAQHDKQLNLLQVENALIRRDSVEKERNHKEELARVQRENAERLARVERDNVERFARIERDNEERFARILRQQEESRMSKPDQNLATVSNLAQNKLQPFIQTIPKSSPQS